MEGQSQSYEAYINNIKELLREDLRDMYPKIKFRKGGNIAEDLKRVYAHTRRPFIFLFDEWDAVFHSPYMTQRDKADYLSFLKSILKGKPYVSLAYMTGILPIAKYSSGSELNMFLEYTMVSKVKYSDYFGFSEEEVDELYGRYLEITPNPAIGREELREWYDGYHTSAGKRLYNPRSVVSSLTDNQIGSYWTNSGPYDEIFYYVKNNINDVRDDIAVMILGGSIPVKIQEYAATSPKLNTKEEILSAMLVYGFLSYDEGSLSIPNKELMDKFSDMVQREPSLGSPLLDYNNETELTAIVNLVYLSARDTYRIEREDKAGRGYVDFIFYPEDGSADGIILELKVDSTPQKA